MRWTGRSIAAVQHTILSEFLSEVQHEPNASHAAFASNFSSCVLQGGLWRGCDWAYALQASAVAVMFIGVWNSWSCQNALNYGALDIGEPIVATGVSER